MRRTGRHIGAWGATLALCFGTCTAVLAEGGTTLVKPTPQQLAWQEDEMVVFTHFGMNTFTDREWGEGTEDPATFNPTAFDARQWARVVKDAGFGMIILTAKHHDGFCLWPSACTEHSVKNSPWRGGKGDVVREVSEACALEGLKFGVYLSPWDRHEASYGDSPAYNAHFRAQLTELLTNYGRISEVWFDGACGEGPNGKRQDYDWASYYRLVRTLQPDALIAICGPDIRWVGNESGVARETEWSVQPASPGQHPGVGGNVWWPAECDVSIRPGWFYHKSEDDHVKPVEHVMDIYFKSVGRNSVLLLNIPPDREGRLAEPDVRRLSEFRDALDRTFATDLALRRPTSANASAPGTTPSSATDGLPETYWQAGDGTGPATLEVDLGGLVTFNVSSVQEYIAEGQRVEGYRLEAFDGSAWKEFARGTTIGHKKLDRFPPVTASRVRLTIEKSVAPPLIRAFSLYSGPEWPVL